MTSVAYPDLTGARRSVERLMVDACVLERDAQGLADDILDESTGELITPAGDSSVLWSGPCLILPATVGTQLVGPLDPTAPLPPTYRAMVPLAAPRLLPGDVLTVTLSARDPLLTGRRLRVRAEGELSTFAVGRSVGLDLL